MSKLFVNRKYLSNVWLILGLAAIMGFVAERVVLYAANCSFFYSLSGMVGYYASGTSYLLPTLLVMGVTAHILLTRNHKVSSLSWLALSASSAVPIAAIAATAIFLSDTLLSNAVQNTESFFTTGGFYILFHLVVYGTWMTTGRYVVGRLVKTEPTTVLPRT